MQGKLHQYHLSSELAKKHSHVTYLASVIDPQRGHAEPEHHVIVKLFASSLLRFPSEREKLLSKAQRLKELDHPHLVPLLDMGIQQDQPFVVREYVPTGSLRSHLRKPSPHPLQLREALSIVSQVGSALAYAHEHQMVHGNLHPDNILLDGGGQALLTDFHLTNKNDALIRDQTTQEYAFSYLAPEQFAGRTTAKSDQYALGCLAYELITGQVPFAAQSLVSLLGHSSQREPVPFSERSVDVPPSLERAVLKALAKDPDERFDDFLLFLEVIRSMGSPSPAFPFISSPPSRSSRTLAQATKSTKAEIVVSPIRKRAAKRSAPEQPEPSHAFFTAVAEMTEPAITAAIPDTSMPEWTGIIPLSESLTSILQPHHLPFPLSENTDLARNADNQSPDQSLKQQSHKEASVTMPSVFGPHEIGTRASEHESTIGSDANAASTASPDPGASPLYDDAVFPSEPQSTANQTDAQEDADDVWLTTLFEAQESHDLPARGSGSLEQEEHESDKETSSQMIVSLPKESDGGIPLRRQTRYNRRKFLGVMLLCLVIVASGTYAAFFPLRTSKPERLVRPTHVVKQALIPVQNSMFPTQPATPTATAQPTPQTSTIPAVIPGQILTIDDSVEGTGLKQFNYVSSSDWGHTQNSCDANPCEYNNSFSWDSTPNDYVALSFTGVQIKLYTVKGPGSGIGAVSLDGGSETMIDTYTAKRAGDQMQWTSSMLPAGTHTFELRITGTKNPRSTGYHVTVDRVDILS
jgi:serine/threonine protein kinase